MQAGGIEGLARPDRSSAAAGVQRTDPKSAERGQGGRGGMEGHMNMISSSGRAGSHSRAAGEHEHGGQRVRAEGEASSRKRMRPERTAKTAAQARMVAQKVGGGSSGVANGFEATRLANGAAAARCSTANAPSVLEPPPVADAAAQSGTTLVDGEAGGAAAAAISAPGPAAGAMSANLSCAQRDSPPPSARHPLCQDQSPSADNPRPTAPSSSACVSVAMKLSAPGAGAGSLLQPLDGAMSVAES